MSLIHKEPVELFISEDSAIELELFRTALKQWTIPYNLTTAEDGQEAVIKLKEGLHHNYLPDLIVLDVNMPKMNGIEVLKELKTHEKLQLVPVIIFSSVATASQILQAYRHHANSFIQKPMNIETYRRVVKTLELYWFEVTHIPDGMPLKLNY